MRAGGARYPQPVHAGVLSDESAKGWHVPSGECAAGVDWRAREVERADADGILRAKGRGVGRLIFWSYRARPAPDAAKSCACFAANDSFAGNRSKLTSRVVWRG